MKTNDTCTTCSTMPPNIRPPALAERWATTTGTLANMRHLGTGPTYFKVGESVLYRMADVLAYEDARLIVIEAAA